MISCDQWDSYKRSYHYAANRMLKIEEILENEYDVIKMRRNPCTAITYTPSREDWIESKVDLQGEIAAYVAELA